MNRGVDELPRAYVVLKEHAISKVAEAELAAWVAERVAKHKKLTGGVVFIHQIPKSPTGKIQRNVLKQLAREDDHDNAARRWRL